MKIMFDTERLILRAPEPADLDDWCSVSDESRADVEEFLLRSIREFEQFGFSMGTLVSKETDEFVGRAGIYHWFAPDVRQDLEIGCYISERQRNKGYGTELTRAMFDWGFTYLQVDRLIGLSDIALSNSHAVLERSCAKWNT